MYKSKIIFYIILLFFFSILLAEYFIIPFVYIIIISVISIILFVFLKGYIKYLMVIIIFFLLGNGLYNFNLSKYNLQKLSIIDSTKPLNGIIISQGKKKTKYTQYKIQLIDYDFKILLKTPFDLYQYGDLISFSCKFKTKNIPKYYIRYLNKNGLIINCSTYDLKVIEHNKGKIFIAKIYKFKDNFKKIINNFLPNPYSSFLSGLFIGGTSEMSNKIIEAFRRTGTSHLVAVSGYNVSLIVTYFIFLLGVLQINKKWSFILLTIGLISFNFVTGFEPSVTRAVMMGWTIVFAKYLGRYVNFRSLILYVAFILVAINPFVLRYDIGFQLSFMATIFLVYVTPFLISILHIEKINNITLKNLFSNYILPTFSAYIGTFPIIAFNFQTISYIAILTNVIVAPFIPLAMFFGVMLIIFSWVNPIAVIFSSLAWGSLYFVIEIIKYFSKFSWATNNSYKMNFLTYAIYYIFIILIIKIYDFIKKTKTETH